MMTRLSKKCLEGQIIQNFFAIECRRRTRIHLEITQVDMHDHDPQTKETNLMSSI